MKNGALFFWNTISDQLIFLFQVQKQTKGNFKFYISKEDTSQFSSLFFRWVIAIPESNPGSKPDYYNKV